MAGPTNYPKGRSDQPDALGKGSLHPQCRPAPSTRDAKPISDDDVLAILSDPGGPKSAPEQPSAQAKSHKCELKRHKKVCRDCHSETSFAFEYCPRCGGPLQVAVIEVP
jgi:hypothetical protein